MTSTIVAPRLRVPGAVAGGFVFAFIDIALRAHLSAAWMPHREAITAALVIALLLVRPQGLLGRSAAVDSPRCELGVAVTS